MMKTAVPCPRRLPRERSLGFTLIELMITVSIVAILAAIALPSYSDYVLRGRLTDATNALAGMRANMELYYQDNRSYLAGPCAANTTSGTFTLVCSNLTKTAYTISATGSGATNGFVYTMDNTGASRTTGLPTSWGTVPRAGYGCWVVRRGTTC